MNKNISLVIAIIFLGLFTGFNNYYDFTWNIHSGNNYSKLPGNNSRSYSLFQEDFDTSWTNPPSLATNGLSWDSIGSGNTVWHRRDYTNGWTSTGSGLWNSPYGAEGTSYSARFHSYSAATGTSGSIITPQIDFSGTQNSKLLIFYYINTSGLDSMNVYVSTNGGTDYGNSIITVKLASSWRKYTVNLDTIKSSQVRIKFTATSDDGSTDIGLDQIYVFEKVPITGIKTIRTSGGDYSSVKQAVDSLNLSGVGTGGVTYLIQSGAIFNESPIIIDATGTSENPLVFRKDNSEGAKPIIRVTGTNNSDACISLNGSDYVTFENLDIRNAGNSSSTYTEYGFYFLGSGNNGCKYDTVKNCTIIMSDSIVSKGIYLYSYIPSSFEGSNSFNAFINDSLVHCYHGYYFDNNTSTQTYYDSSNTIRGENGFKNVIRETRGGATDIFGIYAAKQRDLICTDVIIDSISAATGDSYGIYITGLYSTAKVFGNSISGIYSRGATVNSCGIYNEYCNNFEAYLNTINNIIYYGTGSGTATGIYSNGNAGIVNVFRNNIYGITAVRTSGYATGINMYNGSLNLVFNNVVFDVKADSSNSTQPVVAGMKITGNLSGTYVDSIFHNTVYINYTPVNSANESTALYVQNTYPQVVDLRNNIFVNNSDVTAGNRAIAFFKPSGYNFGNISSKSNNNLYYAGIPGIKNLIFKSGSVEDKTLEEYKTRISTKDLLSVTENPVFRSLVYPFNLNIDSTAASQIESGGRKANFIMTDFNGLPRYPNTGYPDNPLFVASAPDIGAFEFGGIKPSISGTFYIGGGKDFPDLITAMNYFNSRVMTGPVNFIFSYSVDSSYINNPGQFPISINENSGSGPSKRLTIKPDIGVQTIIEGDNSIAIIKLNGADYVTIDGTGLESESRNLTIKNNNTSAPVVFISSLGTNEGARCNSIIKCIITGGVTTSLSSYGIYSGGLTPGTLGDSNDSLIIENNSILKSGYGIYAGGSTEKSDSLFIRNNSIGSQLYGEYIGFYGIYLYGITNASISGNRIFNMKSGAFNPTAVSINSGVVNAEITGNKIDSIIFPGSGEGYGGKGIVVNTGNVSSNITIANNVIYKLFGDGYSSFSSRAISGISIGNSLVSGGINVWYNSISLTGNCTNSSATLSACLYIGTGSGNINVKNNSFYNSIININNSNAYSFAVYSASPSSAFSEIDYNNYYTTGTQGYLGYLSGLYYVAGDTSGWRAATSKDNASMSKDPEYSNSENNLRPDLTSPLLKAGVFIPEITTDYQSMFRDNAHPSIGAYESGIDLRGPVITYTNLSNTTSLNAREFSGVYITDRSSGVDTVMRPRVYYKRMSDGNTYNDNTSATDGWKYSAASGTGGSPFLFVIDYTRLSGDSIVSAGTVIEYFVAAQDLSPNSNVGINSAVLSETPLNIQLTSASFPVSGTIKNYKITGLPMSGTYTIGYSLYLDVSGNEINFEKRIITEHITKKYISHEKMNGNKTKTGGKVPNKIQRQIDTTIQKELNIPYIKGAEYKDNLYAEFNADFSFMKSKKDLRKLNESRGVYARITDAVNDVNERGMSGPVTFLLVDEFYSGAENFPIIINTNSAPGRELTVKPAPGVNTELYGYADCILKIFNNGSVTIDGSNETNGTTRNFIIASENANGVPIWIGSADSVIKNVTVKNCILSGRSPNTGYGAINIFSGNAMGFSGKFSDISVKNNMIYNSSMGIFLYGQNSGTNNIISENFIDTGGTGSVSDIGIYAEASGGTVIKGNSILKLDPTEGTDNGIYVTGCDSTVIIEGNRIGNIGYTGSFGYGGHGIGAENNNGTLLIQNNEIFNIYGDGWDYSSYGSYDNPIGIYTVNSHGKIRLLNNSINLYGNTLNQDNAISCGILIGEYYDSVIICNNSLKNNLGAITGGIGEIAAGIYFIGSYDSMSVLNYNNYFVSSTNAANNIAVFNDLTNAHFFAKLSDWNEYSGKDMNSNYGNPVYLSNNYLLPDTTNSNCWNTYRKGMPFLFVTADIRGVQKSTMVSTGPVCIGAYEFTANINPPYATASGSPVSGDTTFYSQAERTLLSIIWGASGVDREEKSNTNKNSNQLQNNSKLPKAGGFSWMMPEGITALPTTVTVQKFSGTKPADVDTTGMVSPGKRGTGYWKVAVDRQPTSAFDIKIYFGDEELGNITDPENKLILAKYDPNNGTWTPFPRTTDAGANWSSYVDWANRTVTVKGLTDFGGTSLYSNFILTDQTDPVSRMKLDLTVLIQGLYDGTTMVSDVVTLQLKSEASPYTVIDESTVTLSTTGGAVFYSYKARPANFTGTPVKYWIVPKHLSSIETWSAAAEPFSNVTGVLNYDFTTAANKAYGDNLVLIGTKYCNYTGDINQDGTVDLNDAIPVLSDYDNLDYHIANDLNLDGTIDLNDAIFVLSGYDNLIGAIIPAKLLLPKTVKRVTDKKIIIEKIESLRVKRQENTLIREADKKSKVNSTKK